MPVTRTDHNQTYDADGNLVSEEVVEVDITAEVNESTIQDGLRAARSAISDIVDAPAPNFTTIAQARTQVSVLQDQVQTLASLVERLGRLVLRDFDGTGIGGA